MFKQNLLVIPTVLKSIWKEFVFSTADTMEYIDAYKGFRGRAPTTDALLRNRGLDEGASE
jgi:Zn-dependent oligopeptidase